VGIAEDNIRYGTKANRIGIADTIWAINNDGPVKPADIAVRANREPPIFSPIIMATRANKFISLLSFPCVDLSCDSVMSKSPSLLTSYFLAAII